MKEEKTLKDRPEYFLLVVYFVIVPLVVAGFLFL